MTESTSANAGPAPAAPEPTRRDFINILAVTSTIGAAAAVAWSGLYMVWRGDLWERFGSVRFWWMHAMVCVWLIFAVMLFLLEPFVLHRRLVAAISTDKAGHVFDRMHRLHRLLLALALITIFGVAGGAHGLF